MQSQHSILYDFSYKNGMKDIDHMAHRLLGIGALAGTLIALTGLISDKPDQRYVAEAVAYVNGAPISEADIALIAERLPDSLSQNERRARALELQIENVLLLQEAEKLSLVDEDADVQTAIMNNLIRRYAYLDERLPISEAALEQFYAENKDQFGVVKALRLEQIFVARSQPRGEQLDEQEDAQANAQADASSNERLGVIRSAIMAGESFNAIADRLGDPSPLNFPRGLVGTNQLSRILPAPLYQYVVRLQSGAVTDAIETKQGWVFLHIAERQTDAAPPLTEIRPNLIEAMEQYILQDTRSARIEDLKQNTSIRFQDDTAHE